MTMNTLNETIKAMNAQTMVMGNCIFLVKSNREVNNYLAQVCMARENGCYVFNGYMVR